MRLCGLAYPPPGRSVKIERVGEWGQAFALEICYPPVKEFAGFIELWEGSRRDHGGRKRRPNCWDCRRGVATEDSASDLLRQGQATIERRILPFRTPRPVHQMFPLQVPSALPS
jgi:hypothetical protein